MNKAAFDQGVLKALETYKAAGLLDNPWAYSAIPVASTLTAALTAPDRNNFARSALSTLVGSAVGGAGGALLGHRLGGGVPSVVAGLALGQLGGAFAGHRAHRALTDGLATRKKRR